MIKTPSPPLRPPAYRWVLLLLAFALCLKGCGITTVPSDITEPSPNGKWRVRLYHSQKRELGMKIEYVPASETIEVDETGFRQDSARPELVVWGKDSAEFVAFYSAGELSSLLKVRFSVTRFRGKTVVTLMPNQKPEWLKQAFRQKILSLDKAAHSEAQKEARSRARKVRERTYGAPFEE